MTYLEQYKQVYGEYPPHTIEGQRLFNEFRKLLKQYSLDDLVNASQSPVTSEKQLIGINYQHYAVKDVTEALIVSHLKHIHEKWNIPMPDTKWWMDSLRKQAQELTRMYSKEDLHYYMHKLENDSWYRQHITEPFTFKMVRRYIDRNLIDKEK